MVAEIVDGGIGQLGERIGVFGGTFDPVHSGHCALAEQFKQQCALDSLVVIPAATPPHKLSLPLSAFEHRFVMLTLAFAEVQNIFISRLEQFREGPSFTIDTLRHLKKIIGDKRKLFLAIGEDALAEIHTWKQYRSIPDLACLVVFNRPFGVLSETKENVRKAFPDYYSLNNNRRYFENNIEKITLLNMPAVDISSTRIKQAIGENEQWQAMVPEAVSRYIVEHHLYK